LSTWRIASRERKIRAILKALRYDKLGLWRYGIGVYHVICELQESRQAVVVLDIGHRREVYE
jgi:mRNA interferase RelE/StbE